MKKRISLFFLILSAFLCGGFHGAVYVKADDKPKPLEEFYPEFGYTTAEEAIQEFESHFDQDVQLPLRIPPIPFTHYMGKFSDLEGDINDSLELMFINEDSPENHYKVEVRLIEAKLEVPERYIVKKVQLNNGDEAIYMQIHGAAYGLVFEKGNWQYILSVDRRVSDRVTDEVLVQIAESIDYVGDGG
ncbi:hypothetical protein [Oceanobacillus senegalensis]|uniref:hypothetical protein n=1 Tax=Oceanobacillus senegalensis TaxID=1936063 RepID=UPI000A30465B|nr:hypothetical protein [Oceanobacillus senegalensis]